MPRVVIVRHRASADAIDAGHWYEERTPGLGTRFLKQLDASILSISESPLQFPIYYQDIRRSRAKEFPYGVFFVVTPKAVEILAILHLSRNPRWIRRTIRDR